MFTYKMHQALQAKPQAASRRTRFDEKICGVCSRAHSGAGTVSYVCVWCGVVSHGNCCLWFDNILFCTDCKIWG